MPLTLIGLSHHTAPIEVREQFAAQVQTGHHSLAAVTRHEGVREAVILSTCNRTELYLVSEMALDSSALISLLPQPPGMEPERIARFTYVRHENDAVEHLFRVVSSLDSMILGEAQIQGQVRSAYESALRLQQDHKVVGPVLSRLFQSALRVGSRVRTDTRLGTGAASIPSAAVELARKIFGSLKRKHAVILGTGEMSELAAQCLVAEGAHTTIVSRNADRARGLASRCNGNAVGMEAFAGLLPGADIVVAATSAPHAVLTREMVEWVMPRGPRDSLLVVDLALPRDVEPDVGELPNIFLYNLDDLHQVVEGNLAKRRAEVPVAERIIEDGVSEFNEWHRTLQAVPMIRELRERAEDLRAREVQRALEGLRHLSIEDRAAVDALTRQIIAKLLHQPTVRLREAVANGEYPELVDAARYLFELDHTANGTNGE